MFDREANNEKKEKTIRIGSCERRGGAAVKPHRIP